MAASPWLLAARPKTLPAAIVPVWVGSMPLLVDGDPETGSWLLFWCTLSSCLCIQIATNLFNDAIDHKKGADTEHRLGPKRVTAAGMLSQKTVMAGALGFCALAALIAIPMIMERGWPVVGIGAVSLFFAYGYTGGPFPLAYRGMGELFVILFFGFVAVLGSYFVQSGDLGGSSIWILGLQCGLFSSVLIAINNLRDIEEDRKTGKKTLAVRFGKAFAKWEIHIFTIIGIILFLPLLQAAKQMDDPPSLGIFGFFFLAVFSGIPLRGIRKHDPGEVYNGFLAFAGLQLLVFAIVVSLLYGN